MLAKLVPICAILVCNILAQKSCRVKMLTDFKSVEIVNIVTKSTKSSIKRSNLTTRPDGHDLRVSCGVSVLHSEVVTCVVLFYQAVSDHGQV